MDNTRRFALVAVVAAMGALLPFPAVAYWECPEAAATEASCGQSICPEDGIQASDALDVLKAAVGADYCAACRCDVDSSGTVTASDAMRILRSAVGSTLDLTCIACNSLTLHPVASEAASQRTTSAALTQAIGGSALPPQWFAITSTQLPDGRTAQIGRQHFAPYRTRLLLLDETGQVLSNQVLSDSVSQYGRLDCTAGIDRCATTIRWFGGDGERLLLMTVFNVDAVENRGTTIIKDVVEEGEGLTDISTGAAANDFVCNDSGLCVIAWLLSRTTIVDQHSEETERLGYYAAAFHAHTGEVGPELHLADSALDEIRPPALATQGEEQFRVTLPTGEVFDFEVR